MLYLWKCRDCEVELEVQRPLKDIDVPPTMEEIGAAWTWDTETEKSAHDWDRVLAPVPTVGQKNKGRW